VDKIDRHAARRKRTRELFIQFRQSGDFRLRDEIIALNIDLVDYLARKFIHRGEPIEDLLQVGYIGLIKSVDRFDIDRGVEFSTYATPTILGELRRYLRDKGWTIRIPRRLQTKGFEISQGIDNLTQELRRPPTLKEISAHLNISLEETVETIESGFALNYLSLDTTFIRDDEQTFCLIDYIGDDNDDYSLTEYREAVGKLISRLGEREQQVVYMRFFRGMTQTEIARTLHISQMHVSRMLRKILEKLRRAVELQGIME
jgi:RNA polymerase sigma-B factor